MNDIESCSSGTVVQHKITIPEGLTNDQVVQRLPDDDMLAGDIKERRAKVVVPETNDSPAARRGGPCCGWRRPGKVGR